MIDPITDSAWVFRWKKCSILPAQSAGNNKFYLQSIFLLRILNPPHTHTHTHTHTLYEFLIMLHRPVPRDIRMLWVVLFSVSVFNHCVLFSSSARLSCLLSEQSRVSSLQLPCVLFLVPYPNFKVCLFPNCTFAV